ncbi:hypothetical protein BDV98DRAFT_658224 [Pterulicium gracile]|uniref:Uncharacterized protein n=1 Tax=Pterulicium gracile TaxID=1884261 RepID=A0A5C3Q7S8_9AGAR|nr:hypothetical protein BDV98DRAFT_658224 [Pterula gracilis]
MYMLCDSTFFTQFSLLLTSVSVHGTSYTLHVAICVSTLVIPVKQGTNNPHRIKHVSFTALLLVLGSINIALYFIGLNFCNKNFAEQSQDVLLQCLDQERAHINGTLSRDPLYDYESVLVQSYLEYGRIYAGLAAILMESSALYIVVLLVAYETLPGYGGASNVFSPVVAQTEAIAAELVIPRFALGRSLSSKDVVTVTLPARAPSIGSSNSLKGGLEDGSGAH